MKIYPSSHVVTETSRPKFLDIPLAHIEKHYIPTKVVAEVAPEMVHEDSRYIVPYQQFSSSDQLIFKDTGEVSDAELQKQGGKYVYLPPDAKEFVPQEFSFSVLAKRNTSIKSDRNYDFKVGVYDTDGAKELANKLVSICGDAPYRGIAPSNVFVNGGRTDTADMLTKDGKGFDFVFIKSASTEFLENGEKVPYEKFFDSHANLWVTLTDEGCQKCFDMLGDKDSYSVFGIKESNSKFHAAEYDDHKAGIATFTAGNYGYRAKYDPKLKGTIGFRKLMPVLAGEVSPVIICERSNGCYLVISHENMFSSIDKFYTFIYSVMEELYVRSYRMTNLHPLWIADDPVDYMGSLDVPFHKKHPSANAYDILQQDLPCMEGSSIIYVHSENGNIISDHIANDGSIYFRKIERTDPAKNIGETSIFTCKHTVVSYKGGRDKLVESGVRIGTSIEGTRCFVTVFPFSSSSYSLILRSEKTFELEDVSKRYVIRALPVGTSGESDIIMLPEDEDSTAGIVLATVYAEFEGEPEAYDLRQLGGGLPEGHEDYDMMDIGNMMGRPYRMGTGAVITLPKAYEKYDERIRKAVESYKVAADQFYIIYRDE